MSDREALAEVLDEARRSARWRRLPMVHADTLATTADLVATGAPESYAGLHRLISDHGHQRIALFQGWLRGLLGDHAHARVETALIYRIGDEEHVRGRLTAAGTDDSAATDIAANCYSLMFWLLLRDIELVTPLTDLPDPDGFHDLIRRGTVEQWRAALAPVAAHPWDPRGEELAALADDAGLPVVADSLRACQRVYQLLREDDERRAVADEIRRRVKLSGLTQKAFAAYVGTSPSRLSTYVSGRVTPSAAMLLRIQRASEVLAARDPAQLPGPPEGYRPHIQ
ncbi:helix-turn-helix domain-containing protein [Nocardioides thalensis]|uniref:helix-turn-helix domain-containing protein n=1 Tax=Nocardioides thalensis TaxID=1914755 RepID=UPI0015CB5F95